MKDKILAPGFIAAELGEMLPRSIDETDMGKKVGGKRFDLMIEHPRSAIDGWRIAYIWWNLRLKSQAACLHEVWAIKEADARGGMLVWILENGFAAEGQY